MLPNQGNGSFTFHVNAFDLDGRFASLGSRGVVALNASATEPFGAIDTPGQGETISGSYANFGWVLSACAAPIPRAAAASRSTWTAWPSAACGWNQRADLTASFPGYPGINTALGVYGLNTLAYANGLHTIAWVVTDSGGVTAGVGSRFFTIFNTGAGLTEAAMRPVGPDLGRRLIDLAALAER